MLFFKLLTILSAAFLIYCFEDGKIVGGNDVNIARYPFVVSLNFFGWHICGGSIIGKRSVLTAAHCLQGVYPLYLTIYAGSRYRTLPMQRVPVLSAKIHEKYNRESIENDIAIIWLRFDLVFSRRILPVALPIQDEEVYPNTKAQILGWGRTEEGGYISPTLKKITVPVVDRIYCRKIYRPSIISDSMICAGVAEGGKGPCQGDSGGPLVTNGKLTGIVSRGRGCAREGYPGIYTQVSKFRNWIRQNTNV